MHAAESLARTAAWWRLAASSGTAGPLRMAAPDPPWRVTADELHHQVVGFVKQPHAAGLGLCARREGFEPNRQIRRLVLASIWSTPDGSGLLKLGASSIQTD